MSYKNPLNRFRGAELKEPIFIKRATDAKKVRALLLQHPEGMSREQVNAVIPNGAASLNYLRRSGFAKESAWNSKNIGGKGALWFAAEPRIIEAEREP